MSRWRRDLSDWTDGTHVVTAQFRYHDGNRIPQPSGNARVSSKRGPSGAVTSAVMARPGRAKGRPVPRDQTTAHGRNWSCRGAETARVGTGGRSNAVWQRLRRGREEPTAGPDRAPSSACFRRAQMSPYALISTPFSFSSVSNSPDWNISVTISQPPTNSPFT